MALWRELKLGYPALVQGEPGQYSLPYVWLAHRAMSIFRIQFYKDTYGNTVDSHQEEMRYVLCNFGEEGINDGYYLYGVYDQNNGAIFDEDLTEVEDTEPGSYYQLNLGAFVGIRSTLN